MATHLIYIDSTYTESVSSKTISLSEDAYEALTALKKPDESFSDVVRRMTRRRSLTELADIFDAKAGEAIAKAIEDTREQRLKLRRQELGP